MNIHTQPVHQLILFLCKDSTLLTLTQREDPWPQFFIFSHQMRPFIVGSDGWPEKAAIV